MAELPGINEDLTFSKEIAAKILQYKAQRFGTIHLLLRAVLNVTPMPPCVVCVERARGERAKGKKGEESGRPLKYFVELQHWTGALVTCSPRSIGTLYHMIHSINHVPKRPNPSLDKDSSMESKGCVFLSGKLNLRFIVNRHCDGHTMVQLMKIHHKHTYIKRSPSIASDPITKDDFLMFKKLILVNLSLL